MLSMRVHEAGGPLRADRVAEPVPGAGEVLIRVKAAGVNFADTLLVEGRYQERPARPFAPGLEVAGRVVALGPGVSAPPIGARVAAALGHGGFAEAAIARAEACVALPDGLDDATAAVLQVAYGTADLAFSRRARLAPGERLLVTGAAGGVGLTGVELGRLMGAEVIAAARGRDRLALAEAAGAHHLIDTEREDLKARIVALGGADVVYDPVGGEAWSAAFSAARPEARLIPIGFASGEVAQIPANILLVKNLTVIGLAWGAYHRIAPAAMGESLARLTRWAAQGRLRPQISHRLALSEADAALALLTRRQASGKVVLLAGGA